MSRADSSLDQLRQAIVTNPIANYPAATVAAFDPTSGELPRRQLDPLRLRTMLAKYEQLGAAAVLIGASTGQGHLRTVAELEQWLAAAADSNTPRLTKLALLRPEDGSQVNLRLLDQLTSLGYGAVFFRPGTDLRGDASHARQLDQLAPLVAAAAERQLPVGLYSISDVSGYPLLVSVAEALVEEAGGRSLVAIKVTEADYEASTRQYLNSAKLQHLKIVQGWDPHLARALRDGLSQVGSTSDGLSTRQRCGVTSGPMAFAVHQYLHLLAAAEAGDWAEVEAAQQAVSLLFASMQDDPGKFADLQRAKQVMGLGEPLLSSVTEAQTERLLRALRELPRAADRQRLAASLDLMGDGPWHATLLELSR